MIFSLKNDLLPKKIWLPPKKSMSFPKKIRVTSEEKWGFPRRKIRKNTKKSGVGEGDQQRRQEKGLVTKGLFTFINIF